MTMGITHPAHRTEFFDCEMALRRQLKSASVALAFLFTHAPPPNDRDALMTSLTLPHHLAVSALTVSALMIVAALLWAPSDWKYASIILAVPLSWASFIDADRFILPNIITLGLVAGGLAFRIPFGVSEMLPFAIGAVAGFSTIAAAASAYRHVRGQDGLGMGDAKLFAAGGAWLGWPALPNMLLAASVMALIFVAIRHWLRLRAKEAQRVAFGPFIAAAIWGNCMLAPPSLP
jgi:leader peptidase (prepilin peptidase) / N-methyltransferase